MDDGCKRSRPDDDHPGACPVLRGDGAQEERPCHHGAVPRLHRVVLDPVVCVRIQPELHGRRQLARHIRAGRHARNEPGCDELARTHDPRSAVHVLSDDFRDHHGRAGRRVGRGPDALFRLCLVCRRLAHLRLCAHCALGMGRRLSCKGRHSRLRGRHGRSSQRRHRGHRGGHCRRQTPWKTLPRSISRWR